MADCKSCHSAASFHDVTVGPTQHEAFAFPLHGAHVAVPCFECHRELVEPQASSSLLLAQGGRTLRFEESMLCRQCHEDQHGGQFTGRIDGGDCASCHEADRFEGASTFDHGTARFVLDGAHESVACAKCHPRGARADGTEGIIYRPIVPHRCEDCHATPPPVGQGGRS
jgi:hypothetical protein